VITPEVFKRVYKLRVPQMIKRELIKIFGDGELIKAIDMNSVKILMPDGDAEWEEFIRHITLKLQDGTKDLLLSLGVNTDLKIDESVRKMLFDHGVYPPDGKRSMAGFIPRNFGDFLLTGTGSIKDWTTANPKKKAELVLSFDSTKNALVLTALGAKPTENQVIYHHKLALSARQTLKARKGIDYASHAEVFHQAGHVLAGTFLNGTVPSFVTRIPEYDYPVDFNVWQPPNQSRNDYLASRILSIMAGQVAEEVFTKATIPGEQSTYDMSKARSYFEQLIADMKLRHKLNTLGTAEKELNVASLITDEMAQHPLYYAIRQANGDLEQAIIHITNFLIKVMRRHSDVVYSLVNQLIRKVDARLEAREIKRIFAKSITIPLSLKKLLVGTEDGYFHPDNCREAMLWMEQDPLKQGLFLTPSRRLWHWLRLRY